jgi:membrane protease YdiL (CAAX protease family)
MERWGRLPGVVLAAAIYAIAHVAAGNPLLVIAAFGCGLYWGLMYAAMDDLVSPTVSHLVWDVLLLFALPVV